MRCPLRALLWRPLNDQTGTLTLNKMVIQDETPIYFPGETQRSLLRCEGPPP